MKCENCGNDHDGSYGSGRFCDSKCARSYSTKENRDEINRKVSIANGGDGNPKKNKCLFCGNITNRNLYCNNDCKKKYKLKLKYDRFELNQKFDSKRDARFYLINTRGHKCQICGITEWHGKPVPLVMDHIDGNSDNHSFDNCRIICRNCDGLLPTYCKGNKNAKGTKRSIKRNALYHKSKQRQL